MNILYGVAGEGFGHSSRAKEVIEYLLNKGHKVLVVTYGQAYPVLKKYDPLKVEGIHLCYDKKGLSLNKIILENISGMIKNITNWGEINENIKQFSPDLGISDMEPTVSIFCYLNKIPLINLGNQYSLMNIKSKINKRYKKGFLLVKYAVKICVPKADARIVLSFKKEETDQENVFFVNPILKKEILQAKSKKGNHILVYQMKPDLRLIRVLKKIPEEFIVYGYNQNKKDSNITYKKEHEDFVKNLASSKAVVGTAGFTLISEAIFLKKPYFAVPMKGQFEQTLNALFLRESELGEFSEYPRKKKIIDFINKLNFYEDNLKHQKIEPEEALRVLDKIIEKINSERISQKNNVPQFISNFINFFSLLLR